MDGVAAGAGGVAVFGPGGVGVEELVDEVSEVGVDLAGVLEA